MKASRAIHAYLSAFAFIALMFFAVTGFLLNHPNWLKSKQSDAHTTEMSLPQDQIREILDGPTPDKNMGKLLSSTFNTVGDFKSGEIFDDEIMLRFASVKGTTTAFIDIQNGDVSLDIKKSNVPSIIRELHRGKDASGSWRFLIDIIAIITLLLSSIGFFLFFTIRYRLATSLKLCGASLAIFISVFIFTIP